MGKDSRFRLERELGTSSFDDSMMLSLERRFPFSLLPLFEEKAKELVNKSNNTRPRSCNLDVGMVMVMKFVDIAIDDDRDAMRIIIRR